MNEFAQRKSQLAAWITETQTELTQPLQDGDDGLWKLGYQDNVDGWQAQIAILDYLLLHPEYHTREQLEARFRSLFARYDAIRAELATLPEFEDEEIEDLGVEERQLFQRVKAIHADLFENHHQHELLAELLNVDPCRAHDLRHIIGAHYEGEEIRQSCQRAEAATYYPMVKHWIDNGGDVMALVIPEKFSIWLRKVEVSA